MADSWSGKGGASRACMGASLPFPHVKEDLVKVSEKVKKDLDKITGKALLW